MLGASGPAQAQTETEDIIADFCETIADDAEETVDKLADVVEDLGRCVENFSECRGGRGLGNDPLVDCIASGIECSGRAAGDKAEACGEYTQELADAYERALREARREGVENEVQDFFNTRGQERRACLRPALRIGRRCAETTE